MKLRHNGTTGHPEIMTRRNRLPRRPFASGFAIMLIAGLSLTVPIRSNKLTVPIVRSSRVPAFAGDDAVTPLTRAGQFESLDAAITSAGYEAEQLNGNALATNYANQMRGTFTPEGFQLESFAKGANWQSRWRLLGLAYGDHQVTFGKGMVRTTGNHVVNKYQISTNSFVPGNRSSFIEEWFNNTPGGLEHGFTLPERLSNKSGDLCLTIAIEGDLTAQADPDGKTLRLFDQQGEAVLNYEKLKVWDAEGTEIAARMTTANGALVLYVDDVAAKYPLVIDPTFSAATKLLVNDGAQGDRAGLSVGISGNTVIVGAHSANIGTNANQGAAYIFVRGTNGLWTQQAKLTATDGSADDNFGTSVAIAGETAIVGVQQDDVSRGSAYIFVRSGTTWSQQQRLTAGDGTAGDFFGSSVDISGNTAIVGAFLDDVGSSVNQGSAYVFVRGGTVWSQQQKLTAIGGGASDEFGASVAIADNTAIVGAFANDIGGMGDRGSACVFTRSGTTWTQQQELVAADGAAGDRFGFSVDVATGFLSAASAVIGAYADGISGNSEQGSAYVFVRSGTTWTEQQKLTASDGEADDNFGYSVGISGGTVIIGSVFDSVGSTLDQGSAYIFTRSGGTTWNERQRLLAFDGAPSDLFGVSVAISGDTAVVGAYVDDVGGIIDQGSAHVFHLGSKRFDFDDDGRADISVFRPSNGTWYLLRSSAGFTFFQFGQSGDIPVAGDYDGDGETDIAVWRPSIGTWYLQQSTAGFTSVQFGQSGDIPVPADADGDGETDVRLFRPSNGTWYGLNSSNGQFVAAQFGANGDLPVTGNFDGDGFADLVVFRPSAGAWYLLQSTAGFKGVQFGANGDRPVAGDFDGDGRTDVAVFRPSNGTWYRLDSSNGQFVGIAFGQNGDIPAPGDFDGDGKTDLAVFRPANGYWYMLQSTGFIAVQFGASGDIPVPAQP